MERAELEYEHWYMEKDSHLTSFFVDFQMKLPNKINSFGGIQSLFFSISTCKYDFLIIIWQRWWVNVGSLKPKLSGSQKKNNNIYIKKR